LAQSYAVRAAQAPGSDWETWSLGPIGQPEKEWNAPSGLGSFGVNGSYPFLFGGTSLAF